jgi:predicted O-methyltransferase YrrM
VAGSRADGQLALIARWVLAGTIGDGLAPVHLIGMSTRLGIASRRLTYPARAAGAIVAAPSEGTERVLERISEWRESHREWSYEPAPNGEADVHAAINADWPCAACAEFDEVWSAALADIAASGLQVGRGAYGRWDDADPRLARLVWCVARNLRPERVVETGVARGLTTRCVLEALERNQRGHLWSIDLPPLIERGLADQTGTAVPTRLHERWTLVRGSSRHRLPDLLRELGTLDMFVHDSMHTARNVRFELDQAWPVLTPGGVAMIDDVERNSATGDFLRAHPDVPASIMAAQDGRALIGCLVKR